MWASFPSLMTAWLGLGVGKEAQEGQRAPLENEFNHKQSQVGEQIFKMGKSKSIFLMQMNRESSSRNSPRAPKINDSALGWSLVDGVLLCCPDKNELF